MNIIIIVSSIFEIETIIKLNKFAKYVHPKLSSVHLLSRTIPTPIPYSYYTIRLSKLFKVNFILFNTHYIIFLHTKYYYIVQTMFDFVLFYFLTP